MANSDLSPTGDRMREWAEDAYSEIRKAREEITAMKNLGVRDPLDYLVQGLAALERIDKAELALANMRDVIIANNRKRE